MGRHKEDLVRFEDLPTGAGIKGAQRINLPIQMKLTHEAFSGHKVPMR
jgi:hypothetical protein